MSSQERPSLSDFADLHYVVLWWMVVNIIHTSQRKMARMPFPWRRNIRWCIVVVWCSLLYLCLSSLPNCHRCLLLFGLPTATRTLNMLSWSYLKELCFFWSGESACFDTIRAFVVTAHTWKCEWRHKAARCCVTPSLLLLISQKLVKDNCGQSIIHNVKVKGWAKCHSLC